MQSIEERNIEFEQWMNSERFNGIQRDYDFSKVKPLIPTVQLTNFSQYSSAKLWKLLKDNQANKETSIGFGCLDTVQAANSSKYQDLLYVSGWQCSSTASTNKEPGPDFADYPYDTVPRKVEELVKGQMLQDRNQNLELFNNPNKKVNDYLKPIIADADAGFGGISQTMKLTKMFIEAGAAGIHIEDQRPGNKKCGHMGGKVLVSVRENINRLRAARLQADIMRTPLVILSRTDALSAKIIDNNIDALDQAFILGQCYEEELTIAQAGFKSIEKSELENKEELTKQWQELVDNHYLKAWALVDARKEAKQIGFELVYDAEALRTIEGFYRIQGCVELCAVRAHQFLKIADMQWMETPTPCLKMAAKFAELVQRVHKEKFLAYNLSPSFNWEAFNMSDSQIQSFTTDLGTMGFVYQFITLAGFHLNALKSELFARDLKERNMLAYVEKIQKREKKVGVDQLLHQKWSGVNYVDACQMIVENTVSGTLSTSKESTENQFK